MNSKKKLILKKASELGFEVAKFTSPSISRKIQENYKIFLKKNLHGQMQWMERHYYKKKNPKNLWCDVKSILILGLNYGPNLNPLKANKKKNIANISVYAQNVDYHLIIQKKLNHFIKWFDSHLKLKVKTFVDTAPVFEKPLAQKAGLGWQGKHTNIVSKRYGSWLFLSEIFLPIKIESDKEEIDNCGSCKDCIIVCPTNAFIDEYKIDARKCISYLTIEHKGPFPMSLREGIGNKIYGCDDCLSVCPWNKFSTPNKITEFQPKINLKQPQISYFLNFSEKKFVEEFRKSPIRRIGWISFLRNVIIVAGNSKDKTLISKIKRHLNNENPIIRGSSIWSLGKLMSNQEKRKLKIKQPLDNEKSDYVLFEWENFTLK